MNNGRSKTLSGPMSGLTCTAATRNLQTDVAFGRTADDGGNQALVLRMTEAFWSRLPDHGSNLKPVNQP
jgi:hypothetical protein